LLFDTRYRDAYREDMSKLTFTPAAQKKVLSFIEAQKNDNRILRMKISGRSLSGFTYQFFLEAEKDGREGDATIDTGAFRVRIDAESVRDLEGSTVDWVDDVGGAGFKVENPNPPMPHLDNKEAREIQEFLDLDVNPSLAMHGGGAELVDLRGDTAVLKMSGGCQGCGMASATLRQGIEVRLKERFPRIKSVVDVTDHAAGANPYYR
jgi:Fe/S biogenesis protein NfuA